ncbi:unnamed protein product, partial [Meganyctiphanes norvegica]
TKMGDGPGKGHNTSSSSSSGASIGSWAAAAALPFSLVGFKIQQSPLLPEKSNCTTTLPTSDRAHTPQQDICKPGQRETRDKRDKDSKSGNGSSGPTRDDKS